MFVTGEKLMIVIYANNAISVRSLLTQELVFLDTFLLLDSSIIATFIYFIRWSINWFKIGFKMIIVMYKMG